MFVLPIAIASSFESSWHTRMASTSRPAGGTGYAPAESMAELNTRQRDRLTRRQFAYVDREGGEHLPIHDASHTRNAIARFNQTEFESNAAKERARKKILAAAKRFNIEVSEDDDVARGD
jgi:hypothetical protein